MYQPSRDEVEAAMRAYAIHEQRGMREAMVAALIAVRDYHANQAATAEAVGHIECSKYHAGLAGESV